MQCQSFFGFHKPSKLETETNKYPEYVDIEDMVYGYSINRLNSFAPDIHWNFNQTNSYMDFFLKNIYHTLNSKNDQENKIKLNNEHSTWMK